MQLPLNDINLLFFIPLIYLCSRLHIFIFIIWPQLHGIINWVKINRIFPNSGYHHYSCEFESRTWRGALEIALCDKVCQRLAACLWFSPDTQVSPTNKTDRHDTTEILLKVVFNTITPTISPSHNGGHYISALLLLTISTNNPILKMFIFPAFASYNVTETRLVLFTISDI